MKILLIMPRREFDRYLMDACSRSLQHAGHATAVFDALSMEASHKRAVTGGDVELFLKNNPGDMILSVNLDVVKEHTGCFKETALPLAAWFTEDPAAHRAGDFSPDTVSYFCADRTFCDTLTAMGYSSEFLPLAVNTAKFRYYSHHYVCYHDMVSFVGSSNSGGYRARASALCAELPGAAAFLDETAGKAATDRSYDFATAISEKYASADPALLAAARMVVASEATFRRRTALMMNSGENVAVFGDSGWTTVAGGLGRMVENVTYGAAPGIYTRTIINLDLRSFLLPTAPGTRFFDAPSVGAFILVEDSPGLHELFTRDQDFIAFSSEDELKEQIKYYSKYESQRLRVTASAREKILAAHTYKHRIASIMHTMKGL